MSKRAQVILVWWTIIFITIYGVALGWLLHMIPPPRASLPADQIAAFYQRHSTDIKIGAIIASWTSAFMVPLTIVCSVQIARLEKGKPVWAITTFAGGIMMSIFLVLPPIMWGVAAYTPHRAPEITQLMHQLAMLTLTTTDQYYIFMWIPIVIICLRKTSVAHSPYPRWFAYFTAWTALMFEAGAIAFVPKNGPFSWNGLLVFWSPLSLFGAWIAVMCVLLLKAIKRQADDEIAVETVELVGASA